MAQMNDDAPQRSRVSQSADYRDRQTQSTRNAAAGPPARTTDHLKRVGDALRATGPVRAHSPSSGSTRSEVPAVSYVPLALTTIPLGISVPYMVSCDGCALLSNAT